MRERESRTMCATGYVGRCLNTVIASGLATQDQARRLVRGGGRLGARLNPETPSHPFAKENGNRPLPSYASSIATISISGNAHSQLTLLGRRLRQLGKARWRPLSTPLDTLLDASEPS